MSDENIVYSIPPVIVNLLGLPRTDEVIRNHLSEHSLIPFRILPEMAEGEWVDLVAEVLEKGFTCTWDEKGQHVKEFHFRMPDCLSTLVIDGSPTVMKATRNISHLGAGTYRVHTFYEYEDTEVESIDIVTRNGTCVELREWYKDGELATTARRTFNDKGEENEVSFTPLSPCMENVKVLSKAGRTEKLEITRGGASPTKFLRDRFESGDLSYKHQVREDGEFSKSSIAMGDERVFSSLAGDLKEIVLRDSKGRSFGHYVLGNSHITVNRILEDKATYSVYLTIPVKGLPDFNKLENTKKTLIFGWKPEDAMES